jgi:hypothetical protein
MTARPSRRRQRGSQTTTKVEVPLPLLDWAAGRELEIVQTADLKVPLSVDDREMNDCWKMLPIAPTCDPAWFILDSSNDKSTKWARFVSKPKAGS